MSPGEQHPSTIPVSPIGPKPETRAHEVSGWRVPAFWLGGMCIRLWSRTLRMEAPEATRNLKASSIEPVVLMLWHNRLFAVPLLIRKLWSGRRVAALVSASRDGGAFSKFLGFIGLSTVRGSSSRFGREAFNEMVAAYRAGSDIAITPDGPRGPVYEMKAGALLAARRARAPLILVGIRYRSAWQLKSWDRFQVPKPFSRVEIITQRFEPDELPLGDEGVAQLQHRLLELCGESERSGDVVVSPTAATPNAGG